MTVFRQVSRFCCILTSTDVLDIGNDHPEDGKHPPQLPMQPLTPYMTAGPSYVPQTGPQNPIVYNYVNPATGDRIASLLPPNHPEMICLQSGAHVPHTKYGLLGMQLLIHILNSI